ncbi:MAG: hypothetical protein IPK02_05745 [Candidatus Accumulibacter sp.]|uniref:Uncharacterized protein n=1 Tax=Candidatus Accumulibacter affinis TaxID=2954384 RepID=A0A935W433_9PROT|nr:hypothetical protein [Candidatus Accumulibacter affinis]
MGECELSKKRLVVAVEQAIEERFVDTDAMSVLTPGGRFQVVWDPRGNVTAMAQLGFFGEYLATTDLFENHDEGVQSATKIRVGSEKSPGPNGG